MFTAYKKFWTNYVNFTGRSSRSDYWWAILCNSLIMLPFVFTATSIFYSNLIEFIRGSAISTFSGEESVLSVYSIDVIILFIIIVLFSLAILLPNLAISIRRLRDAGFHWSLIFVPIGAALFSFLGLIPFLRAIVSIIVWFALIFYYILLCQPSKPYQAQVQPQSQTTPQQPQTPPMQQPQAPTNQQ
ncbi:hypothetical protein SMU57_08178 [Streptococcus mutans NMT4863]|uniref:DUF805 domain-containing protein n=1 Tax=Streptococcus mutans TaxID=1309 RepID=UPI0002B5A956|nr:DUF805 domain-containing protein [Streptococcus mutans]EMB88022.1 hypothetical protein SMU57_08178 [Streptococcus mutans NMT4863]MCB5063421.1 DUF805 domain-containing protein [Streptococcus mutans]